MKKTLLDELIRFAKKDIVRAHMPGHNGGEGFSRKYKKYAFLVDVTEFDETDNLQEPNGILRSSRRRAAEVFGAEETFFSVNGSTAALEAAILTTAKRGDKVILDRTCHKAALSAVIMASAVPVFIEPEFDNDKGIYVGMPPLAVMDALHNNPDAACVVLTSPTYMGVCSDIETIARNVHSAGLPLIVDEAHGAHFAFSDKLPRSALSLGADIVVQSAHKTLPSPGQTALLHIGRDSRIDSERLRRNLNLIQTSSPSYMLLAGLDEAINRMKSSERLDAVIDKIIEIKSRISVIDKVSCLLGSGFNTDYDITKLVVDFSRLGITGYGAAALLKRDFGIYTELADERNVLFYMTAASTDKDLSAVAKAIEEISATEFKPQEVRTMRPMPKAVLVADPSETYFGSCEYVKTDKALDRVAAEILVCCPPCSPITIPGQLIDEETLNYIRDFTDIERIAVR